MDAEPARLIIEALKEEKIDLYVTLPEEPTVSLTQAVQADPYFQCVTVASEDGGVALTAGAAIAGRRAVFVTGIAGLLKGGLALMHMQERKGSGLLLNQSRFRCSVSSWQDHYESSTPAPFTTSPLAVTAKKRSLRTTRIARPS